MKKIVCDGCRQLADEEHIRRRIERLELATRFRPIHIGVLFLSEAPPPRPEDYFYRPSNEESNRSDLWRFRFEQFLEGCGISGPVGTDEEARLAEFQHRGFFLAHAVECPLEGALAASGAGKPGAEVELLIASLGATVIRRIEFSYKPKYVILVSGLTRGLVPLFEAAGWKDRLLLEQRSPLELPDPKDSASQARFADGLRGLLARASARSAAG